MPGGQPWDAHILVLLCSCHENIVNINDVLLLDCFSAHAVFCNKILQRGAE